MVKSTQLAEVLNGNKPPAWTALLKVNVIKNEEIDAAHDSHLGGVDQSMVKNLPADEIMKLLGEHWSQDEAYRPVMEHSPPDAEQHRVQGSVEHNSTQDCTGSITGSTTVMRGPQLGEEEVCREKVPQPTAQQAHKSAYHPTPAMRKGQPTEVRDFRNLDG